jgi:hypothetical protein
MRSATVSRIGRTALLLAIGVGAPTIATAKDAIRAGVTIPEGEPIPIVTENGSGYTPGTYAIGTIILDYTVVAPAFPIGALATFRLNLSLYDVSGRPDPTYPLEVALTDLGSPHLTLSPATASMTATAPGWNGSVLVTLVIPSEVASDPALNEDGAQLVSSLRIATPGEPHVDTVTNVLVKVKLVHPTACLKVYDFITDTTLANTVTSTEVSVNPRGKVTSTNPYGTLSQNVLIANTCATSEVFDLRTYLDSAFSTQPSNNPGNAVFTFATAGEVDPASFNIGAFGAGTAAGQNLCLQNVTVSAGTSFLVTVKMSINNGMSADLLPGGGTGPGVFSGFGAALYHAASACALPMVSIADPNPLAAPLPFTIR